MHNTDNCAKNYLWRQKSAKLENFKIEIIISKNIIPSAVGKQSRACHYLQTEIVGVGFVGFQGHGNGTSLSFVMK